MANYRRSSIKGAASFRRLLKQLPDSAHGQMLNLLQKAGPSLAAQMQSRVPVRTGALRTGISSKVTPTSLNLKVGLLGTPRGRAKLFYGHILDVGYKGKTVTVKRGPQAGSTKRMPGLQGLYLVSRGLADFKSQFLPDYKKLVNSILLDAAKGAGDD